MQHAQLKSFAWFASCSNATFVSRVFRVLASGDPTALHPATGAAGEAHRPHVRCICGRGDASAARRAQRQTQPSGFSRSVRWGANAEARLRELCPELVLIACSKRQAATPARTRRKCPMDSTSGTRGALGRKSSSGVGEASAAGAKLCSCGAGAWHEDVCLRACVDRMLGGPG